MDKFNESKIFRTVSFLREAHDSSSENYTQHTPNPRLDLVQLNVAIQWKNSAVELVNKLKVYEKLKEAIEEYIEADGSINFDNVFDAIDNVKKTK